MTVGLTTSLLLAMAAANPQVEVSTLRGDQHAGPLQKLTDETLTLGDGNAAQRVPVSELLQVRFPDNGDNGGAPQGGGGPEVVLVDGSRLRCSGITTENEEAVLNTARLGTLRVPVDSVASLRLQKLDPPIESDWTDYRGRENRQDLLVVRKGEVLDHLEGVVGRIDEDRVHFLLQGEEIRVQRERVFGIVYAREKTETEPFCEVTLQTGDVLQLDRVVFDGETMQAGLSAGGTVTLPLAELHMLDFSGGKVRYLSAMEPRDVRYTPFFDVTWEYRRDRNLDGRPLRVGDRNYARGLSIHSKTLLQYRLDGDYRRFQAVMGIDRNIEGWEQGHVKVVIRGDGKPLLETEVRGTDEPRPIDLDVSGVRDLQILVDFGSNLDIADHLDLAEARVIK